MKALKITGYLVFTSAFSYLAYDKVSHHVKEFKRLPILHKEIFEELKVESVPAIKLLYMQFKTHKELSEEQKSKIQDKLEKLIFEKIVLDICKRHGADKDKFTNWIQDASNEEGRKFIEQVQQTAMELQTLQNPVIIDYQVKEELKKKEITSLAYKKYCDYQKYELFKTLKNELQRNPRLSEKEKEKLVRDIIHPENTWRAVFERMGIQLDESDKAELEFRKALYKIKFDRAWLNEIYKIENEHYTIMGAILEFTRANTEESLRLNPLDQPNTLSTYKFDVDLPFLRDISEELMLMLCQRYRALYGREPTQIEIKHQKLLDIIQQNINQSTYKGYKNYAPTAQTGGGTSKSIRSLLSKESGSTITAVRAAGKFKAASNRFRQKGQQNEEKKGDTDFENSVLNESLINQSIITDSQAEQQENIGGQQENVGGQQENVGGQQESQTSELLLELKQQQQQQELSQSEQDLDSSRKSVN